MKKRQLLELSAAVVVALLALGGDCRSGKKEAATPTQQKAEQWYSEGRRLFLTCDPNNYQKAIENFENAMAYQEDYPEALAAWAEAVSMWYGYQLPEPLFQDAYMKAQRSIRLQPELDMGYRAMSDIFRHHFNRKTNTYDNEYALEMINRALTVNPASAENLYVMGSVDLNLDPAKAVEVFNQALVINPNLAKIYFNLSSAHQKLADQKRIEAGDDQDKLAAGLEEINLHYQEAEQNLLTYQKLVPGDLSGYCSLGIVYQRLEKYDLAKQMFQKTVSQSQTNDPSQVRWKILSYLQLAQIQELVDKDLEAARTSLKRILDLVPDNYEALHHLVRLSRALKDEASAQSYEEMLKKALEERKKKEEAAARAAETEAGGTAGQDQPVGPGPGSSAEPTGTGEPGPGDTAKVADEPR